MSFEKLCTILGSLVSQNVIDLTESPETKRFKRDICAEVGSLRMKTNNIVSTVFEVLMKRNFAQFIVLFDSMSQIIRNGCYCLFISHLIPK